jgi:hypothetical protein
VGVERDGLRNRLRPDRSSIQLSHRRRNAFLFDVFS